MSLIARFRLEPRYVEGDLTPVEIEWLSWSHSVKTRKFDKMPFYDREGESAHACLNVALKQTLVRFGAALVIRDDLLEALSKVAKVRAMPVFIDKAFCVPVGADGWPLDPRAMCIDDDWDSDVKDSKRRWLARILQEFCGAPPPERYHELLLPYSSMLGINEWPKITKDPKRYQDLVSEWGLLLTQDGFVASQSAIECLQPHMNPYMSQVDRWEV